MVVPVSQGPLASVTALISGSCGRSCLGSNRFFFFVRGGGRGGRIPSIRQHVRVLRVSVLFIRFFSSSSSLPYPNRPPLNVVKTRVPDRLRRGLAQTRPLHLHPDSLDLLPKVWGKQFFRPTLSKKHTHATRRARSTRRYYSASSARCRGKSQPFELGAFFLFSPSPSQKNTFVLRS